MFRNIAGYKITPNDSSQICDIIRTVNLPKIALHSLFVSSYGIFSIYRIDKLFYRQSSHEHSYLLSERDFFAN